MCSIRDHSRGAVAVNPIHDEAVVEALQIHPQKAHDARIAVVEGVHRVEHVRHHRHPSLPPGVIHGAQSTSPLCEEGEGCLDSRKRFFNRGR